VNKNDYIKSLIKTKQWNKLLDSVVPIWKGFLQKANIEDDWDDCISEATLKMWTLIKEKEIRFDMNVRGFIITAGINAMRDHLRWRRRADRDSKTNWEDAENKL
jgi:DNA-directed RNA polymerase specialized sigma24 family protein